LRKMDRMNECIRIISRGAAETIRKRA